MDDVLGREEGLRSMVMCCHVLCWLVLVLLFEPDDCKMRGNPTRPDLTCHVHFNVIQLLTLSLNHSITQSINAQSDEHPSRSDHERRARNTQHDILSRFFAISRADLLLLI